MGGAPKAAKGHQRQDHEKKGAVREALHEALIPNPLIEETLGIISALGSLMEACGG
jgi:hypothetical protein